METEFNTCKPDENNDKHKADDLFKILNRNPLVDNNKEV